MRLIDANELYGIESLLNTDIVQNSPEASWLMSQVLHDIQASPTIDPETIPIVRQLRADLARVTAERDAAVECIYNIEDDLDRGNDNDWAREHISEWSGQQEDR